MLVRCPHCDVAHAAPRSKPGLVRCGACGRVFEFFPALEIAPAGERVSGPGLTPVEAAAPPPRPAGGPEETPALTPPTITPVAPAPEGREPPARAPTDASPVTTAPAEPPPPKPALSAAPAPAASASRPRGRAPALVLATALLGGLLFQVLAFPPPAVTAEPALETLRGDLCRNLHCPQRPLRAPESVRVSTPSLHGTGRERWLMLDLYNREPRAQAWPLLDISLFDTRGRTHASDRIHPHSYAPEDTPLLPPRRSATIALRVRADHPRLTGVSIRPR
ncbi:DUF3426 domain-containing protein [Thioalkalivibrio sp. ALJ24]|uniref:DUF3426 domain-containing protein n=1 Tax=Thioalkalivibrio sp. ALJ24 TaxID=545276 RepID=UPI0004769BB5|nr:DUF3426 domain-containing protein [Thioalkalivibrio sp. ALJ24]